MYSNLLIEAKKAGMHVVIVEAVLQNDRREILLLEDHFSLDIGYRFPHAEVKQNEKISQAIQRALMEETTMQLKEVIGYLGHHDEEKKRHYYFVATAHDPYAIESQTRFAYNWLDPQEGVGYPITEAVRRVLDLYVSFCQESSP